MKVRNAIKNIKKATVAILCTVVLSTQITPLVCLADSSKVVTLGKDLTEEQRDLMLNYFNVTKKEVAVIDVTNADEHRYLDGVATQQQIGTRTFSCSYIEPTSEGGINIKTANLNWVTCDMIRNALITSGITNCNVICASPIEVSGTGALTGIFMAYEQVSEEELDSEKVEIASEELIKTMDIAETIGQEEASEVVSDLKEKVIVDEITSEDDINSTVDNYIAENEIELTDEQIESLKELLIKISEQEYNIEEIKQTYDDLKNKIDDLQEKAEETQNLLQKIWNWIVTTWQKITGTYNKVKESEAYKKAQEQIEIFKDTKDSLLGDDTVVTSTTSTDETEKNENNLEVTPTEEATEQTTSLDEQLETKTLDEVIDK